MWAAEFIAICGTSLAIPFLPLYVQDLGVKDPARAQQWAGILVSANFVSAALLAPLWGILGDRYGRKPMSLRAILGMAVAIGLMGFARNPWQLLVLRLVQGAVGGFVSASIALVAAAVPKDRLGYSLGTLQTALTAGCVIGPLFGGVLADRIGYRHVFLLTGFLCLVAALLVAFFVQEKFTPVAKEDRVTLRDNLQMLHSLPLLRATFAVMVVTQIGLMVIQPILPLFVKELEAGQVTLLRTKVGLIYAAPGLAAIFAAPFWGRRGDRTSYRSTLALTLLGTGLCYLPQMLAQSALQLALMRFCVGLFTAGISTSANSVVASSVAESRTSSALSLLAMAQWTGSIAGPLLGGFIAVHLGIRPIFLLTGILLLGSGSGAWRVMRRAEAKPLAP